MKQSVHRTNQPAMPELPEESPNGRDNVSGTVLRALGLLDILVAEPSGLGLSATARRAGLNKATAFRLLGSLREGGLIVQDARTGLYRPALKLVRMAEQLLESLDFRTVAHPYVERLAQEVGQGVLAGVLEGGQAVYVDHAQGSATLRVQRKIGGRRSIHVSSMGKAIVAHLPPAEAEAAIAACRFVRRTENTIVDRAAFLAHLAEVRRQGWAMVRDEDELGISSVSAPVFDHTNRVAGAIAITGPSVVLQGEMLQRSRGLLIEVCRAVSAELGHPASDSS